MRYLSLVCIFLVVSSNLFAKTLNKNDVPLPLKPWVDWVLFDEKKRDCPFIYNNYNNKKCAWPTHLELNISNNRSRFSQTWQVFEKTWVTLPGDKKHWPQSVSVNNSNALVTEHNQLPAILLNKGKYQIKGSFYWESIPESLHIPAESALINLYIKGVKVVNPEINQSRIWLANNTKKTTELETDKLVLNVYRLLDDKIPMRVVTHIDMQVSGSSREVNLGSVLLNEQVPVSLSSSLPALLDNKGKLRLQIKPGRWSVDITARAKQNVTRLGMNATQSNFWPKSEVWAFQAQNHLRVVKLSGATRIDPRQTKIPTGWKNLATFRMQKNTALVINEMRRGDQQPQADKLSLKRQMWLDFDGKGYTIKDDMSGTVTKSWRLETAPEIELGRVVIDNIPQFITQLNADDKNKGIEVRRGDLNLSADSRYNGNVREFSATGWNHEFKKVNTTVHLPPGWRIFSASGVDNVPQTWLQKWTLLDLFIVLIISISISRLWSWPWGVFGLVTMSLIWHESGVVPQYIWLNLLAVIAVLKLIPEKTKLENNDPDKNEPDKHKPEKLIPKQKFRKALTLYRNISIVILLLITIPFMVTQVRTGIYPQLEKSWHNVIGDQRFAHSPSFKAKKRAASMKQESDSAEEGLSKESQLLSSGITNYSAKRVQRYKDKVKRGREVDVSAFDPKANVQTGPGLPQWSWNKVYLSWNGPVQKGQQISLILISPTMHTVLNFLRVLFVAVLSMLIIRSIPNINIRWLPAVSKLLLVMVVVPAVVFHSDSSWARSSIDKSNQSSTLNPGQHLLKKLKTRLTTPPDCLPNCAQIQSMVMRVDKNNMQLKLNVHALQKIAIPLPAKVKQWMPSKVMVDGRVAKAMYRAKDGVLWLELPKGRFNVILTGSTKNQKYIQIPLQLKPRIVQSKIKGWNLEGIQENGVPDAQLQLTREKQSNIETNKKFQNGQAEALPPFLIVERHLKLGLDWFVETTVRRISPMGSAVVGSIPIIKGESILTDGVRSKDGRVFINMSPGQRQIFWRSSLDKTNKLKMTASDDNFFTELWTVSASPVWHLTYQGLPVIKHKNTRGRWSPQWHPWKGEVVNLDITRPQGIKGNTLTIEKSNIVVKPGKRLNETQLNLTLRSSQGGQYSLVLPKNSDLQSVKINNTSHAIRLEGSNLTLPITPGKQSIEVVWRNADALQSMFKTPRIDLKQDSVNHSIKVNFGQDRWVLLVGGPSLGPAILFWGVLIVILLLAVGLGFTTLTPLNTLSWILLGVGLSQVPIWMSFIVVTWLFVLALRQRLVQHASNILFNVIQIGIGALTFLSLICLFVVIQQGLLGSPDMQVAGNGSSATVFNWFQDRNDPVLPQAWLLSVPKIVYRLLMLAWALWLAFSLLRWMKWGWQQFSSGGLWKEVSPHSVATKKSMQTQTQSKSGSIPATASPKELPNIEGEDKKD